MRPRVELVSAVPDGNSSQGYFIRRRISNNPLRGTRLASTARSGFLLEPLIPSNCVAPLLYNRKMEDNHWLRDDLLQKYEAGVWIFLIVAAPPFSA